MSAYSAFRDNLQNRVPWWLGDRHLKTPPYSVGFRFLWVIMAVYDATVETVMQGLQAAWPGVGTPTALPLIGRSRGITRGEADTDATFTVKLRSWLTKWQGAGSMRQLAIEIHEYLGNAPKVRIVNRAGFMTTVAADGTVTTAQCAWNWDGTSNPERVGYWSDLWIIIYPTQWAIADNWGAGTWGALDGGGLGHQAGRVAVDAIKGIIGQWKSAHSKVRAVIWTSDATRFDPATPSSLPDGQWGNWGTTGAGARVASHRNLTTCRYWEP